MEEVSFFEQLKEAKDRGTERLIRDKDSIEELALERRDLEQLVAAYDVILSKGQEGATGAKPPEDLWGQSTSADETTDAPLVNGTSPIPK